MTGDHEKNSLRRRLKGRIAQRAKRSQFAGRITARLAPRVRIDETAGWPMIAASAIALLWANLPRSGTYEGVWSTELMLQLGSWTATASLRDFVDGVLLPFFFLVVGLEIREEMTEGDLADGERIRLPFIAAVGGMVVPIAAYLSIAGGTEYVGGFGVPVATDVAFVLALLMILGNRVPAALKAFLLTFAAVDDVGGILVIALFYGHGFSPGWLVAAALVAILSHGLFKLRPQAFWVYLILGALLWTTTALSGIHVTVAGLVFGLLIPDRPLFAAADVAGNVGGLADDVAAGSLDSDVSLGRLEELAAGSESPADRLSRVLHPVVSYFILPVFGLAIAGTSVHPNAWATLPGHGAALGVVAGLLLGKPAGVLGFTWLGVRYGLASLPTDLNWRHLAGAASLSGIGFTVSLFIAKLAFDPADLEVVKLAVLCSSAAGGVIGLLILSRGP